MITGQADEDDGGTEGAEAETPEPPIHSPPAPSSAEQESAEEVPHTEAMPTLEATDDNKGTMRQGTSESDASPQLRRRIKASKIKDAPEEDDLDSDDEVEIELF